MLTDAFSVALSSKTGVPLIPSKFSHSTGVMKVRFEDIYDYDLKLPDGDYVFDLSLKRLAKIQHAKNNVGASYIYGAFSKSGAANRSSAGGSTSADVGKSIVKDKDW
jgi:hypothetical protein